MKRVEALKAYHWFALMLGVLAILPGCGNGVFGGGNWDKPVAVSSTSPASTATAVPTGNKLTAIFSGEMDPASLTAATFTLRHGSTADAGTVTYSGVTAVFTPESTLASNTLYTATITTGAKDAAGHALASDHVWSFTTGVAPDGIAPTVSTTSPANGVQAVPVNRQVRVGFSEAMDPATITGSSFSLKQSVSGADVAGTVSSVGTAATFAPAAPLAHSTSYTATVSSAAKDLAGNAMAKNFVFTFTTGAAADTQAPTVSVTSPTNTAAAVPVNRKVDIGFSEAMDPLTLTTASVTMQATVSGSNVPGSVTSTGASANFSPASNLAPGTKYSVTVTTAAKDLAGNALAGNYVWSFTTGAALDGTAPTVIATVPLDLATGVATNSAVHATFSEAMDPLTLTTATFTLQPSGPPLAPAVAGTVAYDPLGHVATFTPSVNLLPNSRYSATVTTAASDLAGNTLALRKVWSFTTAAADAGLAPGAIALGSAGTFGIMATAAITNTGLSTINGDVSLDPGTSMGGFPPGVVNGAIHINDTVSALARADLLKAYNSAKNLPPGTTVSAGENLGASYPLGIPPGTYTSGSTMLVSTPLVLDAGGNANAVWVFQIGSSLTTGASVSLANGAQAKNVFWVPTLDATIGVGTIFHGTIVSGRDVTGVTGAIINGRILAGATTAGTIALDSNTVNVPAP